MPKRKKPKVIALEELKNKGTKELLGYLSNLQRCEESFVLSDMEVNMDVSDPETIYFKQTLKWKTAYKQVESILQDREHIKK